MAKVRNFAEITPNLPFTEYNFYEEFRESFENTELGRMKKVLPLHEMAKSFGLVSESMMPKRGRKSYFTPEGKVALLFLKMKTQMSFPKLMEALNGNIFYQMFCDIVIDPAHPLTNYKPSPAPFSYAIEGSVPRVIFLEEDEYESIRTWMGEDFDPHFFDLHGARRRVDDFQRAIGEARWGFYHQ